MVLLCLIKQCVTASPLLLKTTYGIEEASSSLFFLQCAGLVV